jgi:mannose-6-phosphate isomerase
MPTKYSNEPLVLSLNRVKRAYIGGKLLDEWQGLENSKDNQYPEEFLVSTVEVTNKDKYEGEGLSKVLLSDGAEAYLRDLIASDYTSFLGEDYEGLKDVGVSTRIGDTTVRIVLQCHPDTKFAQENLDFPNGKAEAWYILETREIDGKKPVLYAGFKEGVTKEIWRKLFDEQDIQGMLDCLHKIEVKKGGTYFVDAGMPHCLGAGVMFLEVHEPCDYTFRLERDYLGIREFSDYELHYGLGVDKLMDAFHFDTMTEEDMRNHCVINEPDGIGPDVLKDIDAYTQEELVSYKVTDRFKVEKLTIRSSFSMPIFEGGHRIGIITKGNAVFEFDGKHTVAEQGRGVYFPAEVDDLKITPQGKEVEMLICYPPKMPFNPSHAFKNPIQLGILVDDLDKYLSNLENVLGWAPWRIAEFPPVGNEDVYREYKGEQSDFKAKFCFLHLGNIEIELIQPLEGKNIWRDWIDEHGQGIHHIKFLVPEHDDSKQYLKEKGIDLHQWGASVGPNAGKEWLFYNTYDKFGFDLETMNYVIRKKPSNRD